MKFSRTASVAFVAAAAALVVACSGTDGSSSGGSGFPSGGTDGNGADGTGKADGGGTQTAPDFGTSPTTGASGGGTTTPKCAAVNVKAEQIPVYLVVIFDKSGSMDLQNKWTSCSAGLKSFFADPKSAGMSASLQFFPLAANQCTDATYQATAVDMRPLPNAADFKAAIDATKPADGTPTLPALRGAIAYAKQIRATKAATDQGKVAVVLVTDGAPNDCNSSVVNVAAAAATVKADIPTYVIGVGNVAAMDTIALAGGTTKAFVVSTTNPAQTATEFQNALSTIRGAQLSCEYQMPQAPAGQTLNLAAVNVVYTSGAGKADTLSYDKDCKGAGWRYDNPNAPSKIQLCKTSCDAVKADTSPKVDVELGCETKGTDGQNIPR